MVEESKKVIASPVAKDGVAGPVVFTAQAASPVADPTPSIVPPFEITPIVFSQVAPTVPPRATAAVDPGATAASAPVVEKKQSLSQKQMPARPGSPLP